MNDNVHTTTTQPNVASTINITPEPEEAMSASFEGLIDLVDNNGEVAFLIKDGDKLVVDTIFNNDESIFTPPTAGKIPFLLPKVGRVLQQYQRDVKRGDAATDAKLFDDLVAYHKSISELPGEAYYFFLAAWDMHTYLQEQIQYSPIICMFAEAERGKSRTGKGVANVAYRGIHLETLREAHLIRFATDYQATMFIDVMDLWKKVKRSQSEDILLHRFEKGAKTFRVIGGLSGTVEDLTAFNMFGPTIIGTNTELHEILDTRAIHITMLPSQKSYETDVTPELGLPLKERLVSFRARHYLEALPPVAKPANGRLGDVLLPIRQIIKLVRPDKESRFINLVQDIMQKKNTEKSISLEAMIVQVVINLRPTATNGALGVSAITERVNELWNSSNENLTPQRIGRKLISLGFDSAKLRNGNAGVLYDERLINKLMNIYLHQAA